MIDKQQDFLTLTGAARLNRAWTTSSPAPATNSTIRPRHPPDAGGIFEASSKQ